MPDQPEQIEHRDAFTPWLQRLLAAGFIAAGIWMLTDKSGWSAALLLVIATVSTLVAQGPHLPSQNIILAALIVAIAGSVVEWTNAETGIPFGPIVFGATGPKMFGVLPWAIPVAWVVVLFNARGIARLVLRPWRKTRTYGFRLIGLTAVLLAAFDFALEPFATRVKQYWFWPSTKFPLAWHGTPVTDFFTRVVVAVLILVFITPLLINKQLSKRRPPDFHPLGIWLGAMVLFGTGAAMAGLWTAVAADAVIAVITVVFAVRGARW